MDARIPMDRESVDRMILLGMEVDRYQAQVIPDLQQRVSALTQALQDLVRAVRDASRDPALATRVEAAAARAERSLDAAAAPSQGARL
jgi:hypothetical protein